MDESELASRSVAVITGTVENVQSALDDASGGVDTYVAISPDGVLAGSLPSGDIVLKETGGRTSQQEEVVYGAPEYAPGEKVLVFLSRNADGSLRTTGMAMGKYRLSAATSAALSVSRTFGSGVNVLRRGGGGFKAAAQRPDTSALEDVIARIHSAPSDGADADYGAPIVTRPDATITKGEYQASFTYLSAPARWWEPDNGMPVGFFIDPTGDPKIGPAASLDAALKAFAAWSQISSVRLDLADAGSTDPQPYAGCNGGNRIVFNDPYNEITDPTNCGGILAIGGYCASWETQVMNGTTYRRIGIGKVMLNNGWEKCAGWNACNLAEVLTHELGHAIGLGHSTDGTATMSASAHFDGRCATVENDDMNGAESLYADPSMPTKTPSASPSPTATPTALAVVADTVTPQPTFTRAPTRTPTPVVSRSATRTRTRTPTVTRTSTRRPTATRTRTVVRTATPTRTPYVYLTRTPTKTRTPTRTRTATRTRTPTRTPTARSSTGADTLPAAPADDGWEAWIDELRTALASWRGLK